MKINRAFIPIIATFLGMAVVSTFILTSFYLADFLRYRHPQLFFLIYIWLLFWFCIGVKYCCYNEEIK